MPRFRFQNFWKTELNTASILLVLNSSKDLEHGTSISLLHVRGCRPSVWVCLTYQSLVNLARVCRWLPCQNMKRNAMQTPIVRSWLIYMCSVQTNLGRSARQKHGQLKLLRLCLGPNELFDRATLTWAQCMKKPISDPIEMLGWRQHTVRFGSPTRPPPLV